MDEMNLRQIRLAKELTIDHMAKVLDIHPNTYSIWESTPSKISIENAYKICDVLGVEYNKHIFLP